MEAMDRLVMQLRSRLKQMQLRYRKMSANSDENNLALTSEMSRMVSSSNNKLHDSYMKAYADLLYRWKMFRASTEMLKCLSGIEESQQHHYTTVISVSCRECGQTVKGPRCVFCHSVAVRCSICRLPCPGLTALCPQCGHGGHLHHLRSWFSQHQTCPTGCGCYCSLH